MKMPSRQRVGRAFGADMDFGMNLGQYPEHYGATGRDPIKCTWALIEKLVAEGNAEIAELKANNDEGQAQIGNQGDTST